MTKKLTWKQLITAQPALAGLLAQAQAVRDDPCLPSFCANRVWYQGGFRAELSALAGWYAAKDLPDFVRTQEAYDLAYQKIYHALPNCRGCKCL